MESSEYPLYSSILDFLERARSRCSQDGTRQLLLLTYAKVVNDCRAMLLLARAGHYIQAGILARSTMDTCSLMVYIGFEGEQAPLVEEWLAGRRVTHWMIVDTLNARLEPEYRLSFDDYREVRGRLDKLVHATSETLELYTRQWPREALTADDLRELTFWQSLLRFYVVTCLLAIQLMGPELHVEAQHYLDQLRAG